MGALGLQNGILAKQESQKGLDANVELYTASAVVWHADSVYAQDRRVPDTWQRG